jgi:hypothetical protein
LDEVYAVICSFAHIFAYQEHLVFMFFSNFLLEVHSPFEYSLTNKQNSLKMFIFALDMEIQGWMKFFLVSARPTSICLASVGSSSIFIVSTRPSFVHKIN